MTVHFGDDAFAPPGTSRARIVAAAVAALMLGLAPATGSAQAAPDAAATPAAAPSSPAVAAAATVLELNNLQEIVITATRHAEVMSKVPVSVSAFSQETLDLKGVKDFTDVARYTPGVQIDANGTNSISIRGISASGGSGTTGIYIDDTPIQMRALGFNADDTLPKTFDLERVEVLRGPQGTLFGAGSEGGTVRYIMAQPNMVKADMYARSEVSFTKNGSASYEAGVAGGAPLIDNVLGFRASIWARHDGGWIDKMDPISLATIQKDANYTNTIALRLAAKWAVNELVTITPSVIYQDRQQNDQSIYWPIYSNPGAGKYVNADPDPRPEPDFYVLPALKIETEIGGASLISNTSYYKRSDLSGYNGTEYNLSYYQTFNNPTNSPYLPMVNPNYYPLIDNTGLHLPPGMLNYRAPATVQNMQKTFAEELRLQSSDPNARIVWTTGIFFSINKQTSIEAIYDPMVDQLFTTLFGAGNEATGPNAFAWPLYNGYSYYNYNFSQDKQTALFGEATYAVTDQLKLTLGARYAKTDVSFNHFADGAQNFQTNVGVGEEHEKPFTPKVGVSYQADAGNLFYATWAKGYRIGGANAPIPSIGGVSPCAADFVNLGIAGEPTSYASDSVSSFEIGAKNKLGDRLRIASSLYHIKWNGIQQNIYLPGCGFQFTGNLGTAIAKGADLQVEWAPIDPLAFDIAIGYTNARYQEDVGLGGSIAKAGDAVVGQSGTAAPPWTLTIGGQYDFTAMDHKAFIRLDYEYAAQNHFLTAAEDSSTGQYDSYAFTPKATTFVSMRAGTTINKWNVSGFVDNLFNSHPELPPSSYPHSDVDPYNANAPAPLIRTYTFRPRTIGVTTTYRF